MNLESLDAEQVEQVLSRHGAHSVTLSDAGDDPVLEPRPGETPLWQETKICGLFSDEVDIQSLRRDLLRSFSLDELPLNRVETLRDRAWEREWLKDFRPMQFGRHLWVCPRNMEVDQPDATVIQLDPGLAFGTGSHETTALCLEWLDSLDVKGKRVLDVGCGSGILSIAALKLGAERVDGVDIDRQAIVASRQNATDNGVSERLKLSTTLDDFKNQYDIVIANILAGTLIELATEICERTLQGGMLALSGILSEQVEVVSATYTGRITLDPPVLRKNWARISGHRH